MIAPSNVDWPLVINLVNSIIGVSLLVMPFCFQKCGVLLGTCLLMFSTWLTYVSCYILVKAASIAKARSYESLAYQTYGRIGKLTVEISIVGLQLGVAVAIFVVIGDLSTELLCDAAGLTHSAASLRGIVMTALALGVTLPLSLQRSLDSLHHTNMASTAFYLIIVVGIIVSAVPSLQLGDLVGRMDWWKTDRVFQCIPIFALSYACQMQMFVIYESMTDATLARMKSITLTGIGICMSAYLIVGFFGYVAFCNHDINGNVLLSLPPSSVLTVLLKLGFVLSMLFSFPLLVFPCRDSLNSLCCSPVRGSRDNAYFNLALPMSHQRLRGFTVFIILFALVVAVLFPNVEFILAITGSTMGSAVGFILPPMVYLKISDRKPGQQDSRKAKVVLICGLVTLCVSTHQTVFNMSHSGELVIHDAAAGGHAFPDQGRIVPIMTSAAGAFDYSDLGQARHPDPRDSVDTAAALNSGRLGIIQEGLLLNSDVKQTVNVNAGKPAAPDPADEQGTLIGHGLAQVAVGVFAGELLEEDSMPIEHKRDNRAEDNVVGAEAAVEFGHPSLNGNAANVNPVQNQDIAKLSLGTVDAENASNKQDGRVVDEVAAAPVSLHQNSSAGVAAAEAGVAAAEAGVAAAEAGVAAAEAGVAASEAGVAAAEAGVAAAEAGVAASEAGVAAGGIAEAGLAAVGHKPVTENGEIVGGT